MEALKYKHRGQAIVKIVIGIILIILGILNIIFESDSLGLKEWIRYGLSIIFGALFFTPVFGSDISYILPGEPDLKIKWRNWLREKLVRPAEIEKIILGRLFVLIYLKEKKPVKIQVNTMKPDQRTEVYNFFIGYAGLNNLVLEKVGLSQE